MIRYTIRLIGDFTLLVRVQMAVGFHTFGYWTNLSMQITNSDAESGPP